MYSILPRLLIVIFLPCHLLLSGQASIPRAASAGSVYSLSVTAALTYLRPVQRRKPKSKKVLLRGTWAGQDAEVLIVKTPPRGEHKVQLTQETRFRKLPVKHLMDDPNYLEVVAHNDAQGRIIAEVVSFFSTQLAVDRIPGLQNSAIREVASNVSSVLQNISEYGLVMRRGPDTITIRGTNGEDKIVRLTDRTRVRVTGGLIVGNNYAQTSIVSGLRLQVEGRRNISGQILADRIRFDVGDYNTAPAGALLSIAIAPLVNARVAPVSKAGLEDIQLQNMPRSPELPEASISRSSGLEEKPGEPATANRATAAVSQTWPRQEEEGESSTASRTVPREEKSRAALSENQILGAVPTSGRRPIELVGGSVSVFGDAMDSQRSSIAVSASPLTIRFRSNSAILTPQAKIMLNRIGRLFGASNDYLFEIRDSAAAPSGSGVEARLMSRRRYAVVRYLVEHFNLPIRRFVIPPGLGGAGAPSSNETSSERRQQNVPVLIFFRRELTMPSTVAPPVIAPAAVP